MELWFQPMGAHRDRRKFYSSGLIARSLKKAPFARALPAVLCACLASGQASAGEDPAARVREQHQLQRRQQEEALQLRMRQHELATKIAPGDVKAKQAMERRQAGQRERQQTLHYRQSIERPQPAPGEDEGARRARAELERMRAQRERDQQMQRLQSERPAP